MNEITAILTAYRRPALLRAQAEAVRQQSAPPHQLWLWANAPDAAMQKAIEGQRWDRTVICGDNAHVHARFALALLAATEFVAVFDDDALPGAEWFANCLRVMTASPGILGSAGVRLVQNAYRGRTLYGWHAPQRDTMEVDLVGHAWFLRTEWVKYLFAAPAVVGTNGEDIELAARAFRLGGVRCFCPPHPPDEPRCWGSLRGVELGSDAAAMSRRPTHLDERDQVVQAEVAAGWPPLYLRMQSTSSPPSPGTAVTSSVSPNDLRSNDATGSALLAPLLAAVPLGAKTILHVRCGTGSLGAALKARQPCLVVGIEADPRAAGVARQRLDEVIEDAAVNLAAAGSQAHFDCIVCERLEQLIEPAQFLTQVKALLAEGDCLLAACPNVRHHALVSALLDGNWADAPAGCIEPGTLRFFTRREVEKLLDRTGFAIESLRPVPGPGHDDWVRAGRPGHVRMGGLDISGLPSEEAEEFYASHFVVRAVPPPAPAWGVTSIVLVTHGQLVFTRMCIESIRLRTDEPHELIVVDNASPDDTVQDRDDPVADALQEREEAALVGGKGLLRGLKAVRAGLVSRRGHVGFPRRRGSSTTTIRMEPSLP